MTDERPTFTISPAVARHLMKNSSGRFFSATFRKRTNGEMRTLVGRLHVQPKTEATRPRAYKDSDHDLLTVFVPALQSYRTIPLDAVTKLGTMGANWEVRHG